MAKANYKNRTLYHGDNLKFLRGMNSGTVHLIATDPPFNKSKDFHATPDSLAAGAKFTDRWSWEKDVHEEWVDSIKDDWPGVWKLIDAALVVSGKDMAAFLCWLGVRLMAMHRVLRDDGSLYLHCDPTASHYLKALLDAIFGRKNFRNEIVWGYKTGGVPQSKGAFARKHDIILLYSKTEHNKFNTLKQVSYSHTLPEPHTKSGKALGMQKDSIGKFREVAMRDWWIEYGVNKEDDVTPLYRNNRERVGYPTQKPLKLMERIIKSSSNKGDIILDPFCGCATTCIAAERLDRHWVGIDNWDGAKKAVLDRLEQEGLAVPGRKTRGRGTRTLAFGDITYSTVPPVRTDDNEVAAPNLKLKVKRPVEPWEKMTRQQMFNVLVKAQSADKGGVICAGCGRAMEKEFMELDHISPKVDGGENNIRNRILLCAPCNGRKSGDLTLRGLVKKNKSKDVNWMKDEELASWAQRSAKAQAEWVQVHFDTDECKALMQEG